jgi:hyaluronoglucosaminidase
VIEGFYGPPWTHEERLDLLAFCGRHELNTWVHAPKDDPYHRARWRDPYPEVELERLGELVRSAERYGVEFVWAVAPGLSINYTSEAELEALAAKCDQLRSVGVRTFHLLWDDIEHDLPQRGDLERYGDEVSPSAAAQADLSNRFRREYLGGGALVVCPIGYAGNGRTPYRETFGRLLDPEVVVYWTGPDVVPEAITRRDLDEATAAFGHELLLWDNYPVNDFDRERLFLGPLRGRDPALDCGLVANGMLQAVPSKLALATVADYAREPRAYDTVVSFERALAAYAAEVVEALRRLAAEPVAVTPPGDVAGLVQALAPGVDAATGLALLEPFV